MTNDEVNRWKLSAERIAELRGFIDQLLSTHNMYECIAIRDMLSEEITHEPFEQRRPFAGLQSLSFDVSENPTIALVMRFDNIEHAQAARHQLWQPAGAFRDASPADLVGALQDVVHTDPGPVRAGKAHRDANSWADAKGGLPDNKL